MWSEFWRILLLSGVAGLATGIGGLIAFFSKKDDRNFLALTLGFSSGVMIYISFLELLLEEKVFIVRVFTLGWQNRDQIISFNKNILLKLF